MAYLDENILTFENNDQKKPSHWNDDAYGHHFASSLYTNKSHPHNKIQFFLSFVVVVSYSNQCLILKHKFINHTLGNNQIHTDSSFKHFVRNLYNYHVERKNYCTIIFVVVFFVVALNYQIIKVQPKKHKNCTCWFIINQSSWFVNNFYVVKDWSRVYDVVFFCFLSV